MLSLSHEGALSEEALVNVSRIAKGVISSSDRFSLQIQSCDANGETGIIHEMLHECAVQARDGKATDQSEPDGSSAERGIERTDRDRSITFPDPLPELNSLEGLKQMLSAYRENNNPPI